LILGHQLTLLIMDGRDINLIIFRWVSSHIESDDNCN